MVDKEPVQAQAAEEQSAPKARFKFLENKVVLLGVIVILQIVMAVAITQFVIVPRMALQQAAAPAGGGVSAAGASDAQVASGIIVGLEEIIVTLRGQDKVPNYLRINVNLEVDSQKTADLVRERLPQLRDIVILTLSSMRADDLITPEGNQAVRSELFRRLAEKMPADSLRGIYFSDLVIQ
jgi:flagellar FliL protein